MGDEIRCPRCGSKSEPISLTAEKSKSLLCSNPDCRHAYAVSPGGDIVGWVAGMTRIIAMNERSMAVDCVGATAGTIEIRESRRLEGVGSFEAKGADR